MFDRVILHLGATKTGTTAIQTALHHASDSLAEQGTIYPALRRARGDASRVNGNGKVFKFMKRQESNTNARRSRLRTTLQNVVGESVGHTLLFSAEGLQQTSVDDIQLLKAEFERYGPLEIVYFVRHVTDHALSQYGEYIRRRRLKDDFSEFAKYYKVSFLDVLRTWSDVCGTGSVKTYVYDPSQDAIANFFKLIGAEPPKEKTIVHRSLSYEELALMRWLNTRIDDRLTLVKFATSLSQHPSLSTKKLRATSDDLRNLTVNNAHIVEQVNREFVTEGELKMASDKVIDDTPAEEIDLHQQGPLLLTAIYEALNYASRQSR
ncbi:MAG: hypothetical protein AAFX52_12110 [Pseudomonadota bacterium]